MNYESEYHKLVIKNLALKKKLQDAENLVREKTIIVERMLSQVNKYRP